ncbi:hypothetical protein COW46_00210 [Candidatus Gracilibacteria bacterium CG17_big_fil_post_rev_8_21_14_2_50_48_13]|nr:MAG: hypothetical protein COW46_00210 [Candidatus Gracilibacteria bacterium CG17_big_fil_post_rev_8_21_14_2_50_48_13]
MPEDLKPFSMIRRFLSVSILVTLLGSALPTAFAATFQDVPSSDANYRAIEYFADLGVIEGYLDSKTGLRYFKPTASVNRAEAVKMMLAGSTGSFTIPSTVSSNVFPDVKPADWFAPYVSLAKAQGIVKGNDATGLFDPARTVNKAELLKMVILANSIDLDKELGSVRTVTMSDVSSKDWFYSYMRYAKAYGIIAPDALGKLDPGKALTRAEVARILYNIVKVRTGGDQQVLLSRTEASIVSSMANVNIKEYDAAIADLDEAKKFAEAAKNADPSNVIVQEAYTIAQSYAVAIRGFVDWKRDNNVASAKASALEAERLVSSITVLTNLQKSLLDVISRMKSAS